jgi:hypothetical protein
VPPTLLNPSLPFPYLTGFFASSVPSAGQTNDPTPEFHRLLEFVHVPSRFLGTEIICNPDNSLPAAANCNVGNHMIHPPFNRLLSYREPGKINVNTITSGDVFAGLMNYFPGLATADFFQNHFLRSRRGGFAGAPLAINPSAPTRIENPFRSFQGMQLTHTSHAGMVGSEVGATLLRADVTGGRPLFAYDGNVSGQTTPAPAVDYDRNPYFRYESLTRLGNIVTTRSNVFAVWITVGYFEVTPGAVDLGHPDGYRLGQELGSDTGDIKRHRAFFILDRTIPVGFERGKDLNVDKAILLRRYIE